MPLVFELLGQSARQFSIMPGVAEEYFHGAYAIPLDLPNSTNP